MCLKLFTCKLCRLLGVFLFQNEVSLLSKVQCEAQRIYIALCFTETNKLRKMCDLMYESLFFRVFVCFNKAFSTLIQLCFAAAKEIILCIRAPTSVRRPAAVTA